MRSRISSHPMKSREVWNSRLRVRESREVRFLTQREKDSQRLILPRVSNSQLFLMGRVMPPRSWKKLEVSASLWKESPDLLKVDQVAEVKTLLD